MQKRYKYMRYFGFFSFFFLKVLFENLFVFVSFYMQKQKKNDEKEVKL